MIQIVTLILSLLLSQAFADGPNSDNSVFINPSSTASDPVVWEIGSTQVIQWSTTASDPITLDFIQYVSASETDSTFLFQNQTNITEFEWTVNSLAPLASNGTGLFRFRLVPPDYTGQDSEGFSGNTFTIRYPNGSDSSSTTSSVSSSTLSVVVSTTSPITSTATSQTTTATTSTPSDSAASTPSSGLSSSAKEGLGIGLGIGLTALILLNVIAVLWYRRRHKRGSSGAGQSASDLNHSPQGPKQPPSADVPPWTQKPVGTLRQEMGDTSRREMADTSRGELDGDGRRAELSAWRQ